MLKTLLREVWNSENPLGLFTELMTVKWEVQRLYWQLLF